MSPVSNLAGVARHVLDAARASIPGYSLAVAAPEGPLLDELRRLGVQVHPVSFEGNPATIVKDLRGVIATVKPAVVHSHLAKADFIAAAATLGLPCRVVSTEHGIAADAQLYNRGRFKANVRKTLHHARTRRFDALIAVSESTKQEMIRAWRPTTEIEVILNGVDRPASPKNQPRQRFLSLARLAPEKRIPDALRAFATASEELPGATLTIAGDGPEREELTHLTQSLGIADRVTFPGYLDATTALAEHDVLVQLSAWENASYSILDAVVHGLGVVATPVGGNPEILPHHCLSDADDHQRVAELMIEQANSPAKRPTLPSTWPTVSEMTARIADVYERDVR